MKKKNMNVKGADVAVMTGNNADYISLTDIARFKDPLNTDDIIKNWLRNRNTVELLGFWEMLYNADFKPVEFDGFRKESGLNSFVMTAKKWIESTHAIGIISKQGRYGGTFAHKDIAMEFASWISIEFKLYLIKEFQRLKAEEHERANHSIRTGQDLEWNLQRMLAKVNYHIHTDAIKENLVPAELTKEQMNKIYADEADMLNVALFGMTAKQWREQNRGKTGNIRDQAAIEQLVVLSNMESLNAVFIRQGLDQRERLIQLNSMAITQMRSLVKNRPIDRRRAGI